MRDGAIALRVELRAGLVGLAVGLRRWLGYVGPGQGGQHGRERCQG